jgi:hypothetical protein
MIEAMDVAHIAENVAREKLGGENVVRAVVEPMVDWTGADAWRVLIVLTGDAVPRISGEAALENLVGLQNRIQRAGDSRIAFVEYATEEELAEGSDTEC